MLRNERTNITESLPQVIGWMNDEQLLISKRSHPDSPARALLVEAKTGKLAVLPKMYLFRLLHPQLQLVLLEMILCSINRDNPHAN